jgi:hypothetical protein
MFSAEMPRDLIGREETEKRPHILDRIVREP